MPQFLTLLIEKRSETELVKRITHGLRFFSTGTSIGAYKTMVGACVP